MSTFLIVLFLQLGVPPQTAAAPNPIELCTIRGVVTSAGTGEPLNKAEVTVWPETRATSLIKQVPEGGTAETDALGRFEIRDLVPGDYRLTVRRNGFVTQQYGQRGARHPGKLLTLSSGQTVRDIAIPMIPAAVISGHVYDEDGEPVVFAQVTAMHHGYVNGQRQLEGGAQGMTNDLGEFRIFGLSPGEYFVQANDHTNRPPNRRTAQGYIPIYYPGVPDPARAQSITVRGGEEFPGVDITLQSVRTFLVRGSVSNPGCGPNLRGTLVFLRERGAGQNTSWVAATRPPDDQGAFEIASVFPGSYEIFASRNDDGKQCLGREPVEVTDSDIDGVALTVTPGIDIKGRIRVDGQLGSNVGSLSVYLLPVEMGAPFGGAGSDPAKPDGSFLLKNAFDGDYQIEVNGLPENSFVKSARLDGVDAAAILTLDTKQAPGLLEIEVSPNGANVDGAITKDRQPFPGATVALVPDPPHRNERRLFKSTTTDQNGHFVMQGLPPGDYKVFAWEKVEPGACTSAEFLQSYENQGESVHITEGSRNTVQVDLIPAGEASP